MTDQAIVDALKTVHATERAIAGEFALRYFARGHTDDNAANLTVANDFARRAWNRYEEAAAVFGKDGAL